MPQAPIKEDLDNLLISYNQIPEGFFKSWFFPASMEEALAKYESDTTSVPYALAVCKASEETWFFQRWFFDCLFIFSQSFIMKAYRYIGDKTIVDLEQDKPNRTRLENFIYFREELYSLPIGRYWSYSDTSDLRTAIESHEHPIEVSRVLSLLWNVHLHPHSLATKDNFKNVLQHPHPEALYAALNGCGLPYQTEQEKIALQSLLDSLLTHSEALFDFEGSLGFWQLLKTTGNALVTIQDLIKSCEEQQDPKKIHQMIQTEYQNHIVEPKVPSVIPTEPKVEKGEAFFDQKALGNKSECAALEQEPEHELMVDIG